MSPEALTPDPSDCPQCGDGRDSPRSDCANCGFIQPAPCGDPSGRCLYVGPHDGDHKVAPMSRAARQEAADTSGLREAQWAAFQDDVRDWGTRGEWGAPGDDLHEIFARHRAALAAGATERPLDGTWPEEADTEAEAEATDAAIDRLAGATERPLDALARALCGVVHPGTDMEQNGCADGHRALAAALSPTTATPEAGDA
jgi:hypothetical protein